MLLPVGTSLQELLLEFEKQSIPQVLILVVHKVEHFGNGILTFLELVGVLLASGILVILKQGHDELNKLVDGLGVAEWLVVLDH